MSIRMSTERAKSTRSAAKPAKKKRKLNKKRWLIWLLIALVLGAVCAAAGYVVILLSGEKQFQLNKDKLEMSEAAVFFDVNNKEVTTMARENRELVTMAELPEKLPQAFVATEDKRFSEHSGIDFFSIGRAVVKDIIHRSAIEGGSTITQQLAKNMFLNADKTLFRKATEASIAIALENHLTKDQILEMYMNRIYFGNSAWGVKAAAKKYFGKSDLKTLNLAEMATLAAIPKAPSHYNPLDNPERSKERRAVVLQLMYEQGYITEQEKNEANANVYAPPPTSTKKEFVTFLDYAVSEAVEKTGLTEDELLRGGYQIYTTLEPTAQKAAETAYANPDFFQKDGPEQIMQSGMVILNNKDAGIVAMIGGRDYKTKTWNRAIKPRQPGSSFKPIIDYAPAMELKGFNPYTMLTDEKLDYNGYSPNNWDNVYLGKMSMMKALEKSANAPAVWTLNEVKVPTAINFAETRFGIKFDPKDRNLAIALGGMTTGVSPLQLANAYTAFANNGQLNASHSIVKVVDNEGNEKYKYKAEKPVQAVSPKTAYYMTQMLKNAVDVGTGASAKMNRPVAGKTGSTQLDLKGLEQYYRDVWFAGYTPEWTAAIWMGFDTTDAKHYVNGGSGRPAALFKEIMSKALAGKPVTQFQKPNGVPDLTEGPAAVSDLAATYNKGEHAVKLSWTAVKGDNIAYKIFRKGSKDAAFGDPILSPTTEFKDFPKPGETYQYYVVAFNQDSNLESGNSNVVTVTVEEDNAGATPSPTPGGSGTPKPTPTPTPSGKPTPTPSGTPPAGGTPTPTKQPTPTPSPTATPSSTPASGGLPIPTPKL